MKNLKLKESTSVLEAKYDEVNCHLYVTFQGGDTYKYYQITSELIEKFEEHTRTKAGSVGSWMHHNVKTCGFKYEKVG